MKTLYLLKMTELIALSFHRVFHLIDQDNKWISHEANIRGLKWFNLQNSDLDYTFCSRQDKQRDDPKKII
ncbi:MAG: hypothetical protein JWM14_94 [Chitinophagaceae bacterium]|nr:hypothetical protein [Chitinophagaceae bacterium]